MSDLTEFVRARLDDEEAGRIDRRMTAGVSGLVTFLETAYRSGAPSTATTPVEGVVRAEAAKHADHPDYRAAWRR